MSNVWQTTRNNYSPSHIQWPKSRAQYNTSIKKFLKYLHWIHTHPSICYIFEKALTIPTSTIISTAANYTENNMMIKEASLEQDEIKWINIFKEHISRKLVTLQLKHYIFIYNNPPSIIHWAKNVIIQIYNIPYNMWTDQNKEIMMNLRKEWTSANQKNYNMKSRMNITKVDQKQWCSIDTC